MTVEEPARTPFDDLADFVLGFCLAVDQIESFYNLAAAQQQAKELEQEQAEKAPYHREYIAVCCTKLYGPKFGPRIAQKIIDSDQTEYTEDDLLAKKPWEPIQDLKSLLGKWSENKSETIEAPGRRKVYTKALMRHIRGLKAPVTLIDPDSFIISQLHRNADKTGKLSDRLMAILRGNWRRTVEPFNNPDLSALLDNTEEINSSTVDNATAKMRKVGESLIPTLCQRLRETQPEAIDPHHYLHVTTAANKLGYPEITTTLLHWHQLSADILSNMATNPGLDRPPGNNDSSALGIWEKPSPRQAPPKTATTIKATPERPNVRPGR